MQIDAENRVRLARNALLKVSPFFGVLSLNLKLKPSDEVAYMATDGEYLYYNPKAMLETSMDNLKGIVAHEVMHCALRHFARMQNRDRKLWNMATDYAVNLLVTEAGLCLPQEALLDHNYKGMTAEAIYESLRSATGSGQGQSGNTGGSGNKDDNWNFGEVVPQSGQSPGMKDADQKWLRRLHEAANAARLAGRLPLGIEELVKGELKPKVPWRDLLRKWVAQNTVSDFSWSRPNRKLLSADVYLPSTKKEGTSVVVAVDSSGSIDTNTLEQFVAEVNAIREEQGVHRICFMTFDTKVYNVEQVTQGELWTPKITGRGGTNFIPVFDEIRALDYVPDMIIVLTDLEGTFPSYSVDIPTLWVSSIKPMRQTPFGDVVEMS